MYALVFAPHGIVGEDGSKVVVTDTLEGAQWEMQRQVTDYIAYNELAPLDRSIGPNHATVDLSSWNAPEWHIYEV